MRIPGSWTPALCPAPPGPLTPPNPPAPPGTWPFSLCSPHYECVISPSLPHQLASQPPSHARLRRPQRLPAAPTTHPGDPAWTLVYLPVYIKRSRMLPSKEEKAGLLPFSGPFRNQRVSRTRHHLDSPNTTYELPEKGGKLNRCSPNSPSINEKHLWLHPKAGRQH